jgi:1-aminocyclopropane-1-carboxylate deaminase/D-cysteine desulfhydrase-like pyridoxal-dependent ACC family enzyme
MEELAATLEHQGRKPVIVPLGASTPRGAMGVARAIGEIVTQGIVPDVIVHASSSGGTQAGLVAGCALFELRTRVIGVSADDPADAIGLVVRDILRGIEDELSLAAGTLADPERIEVDAGFVGDGYGVPTDASREAQHMAARTEALFVEHWYTAKALAALVAYGRAGRFKDGDTVMFWHTGGQSSLFA